MARKKSKIEKKIEGSVESSIETSIEEIIEPIEGSVESSIETPIEEIIETPIEEKSIYVIAEGRAITSRRGILGAGDEVKNGDIPKMSFDKFIEIGHIIKKGE